MKKVQAILLAGDGEAAATHGSSLAIVYLVRFIVSERSMPAPIERRWKQVGVIAKDGSPNAAMRRWRRFLLAGEESEGVLRGILSILGWLYDEGDVDAPEKDLNSWITA